MSLTSNTVVYPSDSWASCYLVDIDNFY